MRYILHLEKVGHRPDFNIVNRSGKPIADREKRIEHQAVIHVQIRVIEAGFQREGNRPHIFFRLKKRIHHIAYLQLHIHGIGITQTHIRPSLRSVHQSLLGIVGHRLFIRLHKHRPAVCTGLFHHARVVHPFLTGIDLFPYLNRKVFRHCLRIPQRLQHTVQIAAQTFPAFIQAFHYDMYSAGCLRQHGVYIVQIFSSGFRKIQLSLQITVHFLPGPYSRKVQFNHTFLLFFLIVLHPLFLPSCMQLPIPVP